MIDARRWVLVEAWLALGLRIAWAPAYRDASGDEQLDEELRTRFYYDGHGVWHVVNPQARRYGAAPEPTAPQLGWEALRHELAHWIAAPAEARAKRNFGLTSTDTDAEERALEVEAGLDAMLVAAGRIADLALAPAARRPL